MDCDVLGAMLNRPIRIDLNAVMQHTQHLLLMDIYTYAGISEILCISLMHQRQHQARA
jgi:hypothetical protein